MLVLFTVTDSELRTTVPSRWQPLSKYLFNKRINRKKTASIEELLFFLGMLQLMDLEIQVKGEEKQRVTDGPIVVSGSN